MTSRVEFSAVVRAGRRMKTATLVLHQSSVRSVSVDDALAPARVGLVVSKSVGNSVVRHRVSRRLRAQLARRLSSLPAGSGTVVRALPAASSATSAQLGADVSVALERLDKQRRG